MNLSKRIEKLPVTVKRLIIFHVVISLLFAGILLYIGLQHNTQGEFYISDGEGRFEEIDFAYILIFFLWHFSIAFLPLQCIAWTVYVLSRYIRKILWKET